MRSSDGMKRMSPSALYRGWHGRSRRHAIHPRVPPTLASGVSNPGDRAKNAGGTAYRAIGTLSGEDSA